MISLTEAIEKVQVIWESELAPTTIVKMSTYVKRLLKIANQHDIIQPCQQLYDLFMAYAVETGSQDVLTNHHVLIKAIDLVSETRAINHKGVLYNDDFGFPPIQEVQNYFSNFKVPYPDGVNLLNLCSLMLVEASKWDSSASTIYQYGLGAKDIIAYFSNCREQSFDRELLMQYVKNTEEFYPDYDNWRRKLYVRAANMLLDIADTGKLEWKVYRKRFIYDFSPEISSILEGYRQQKEINNLSPNYVGLYMYVAQEAMSGLKVTSLSELNNISENVVITVLKQFNKKCCENSMATLMPMLRNFFSFLYEEGFTECKYSYLFLSPNYKVATFGHHLTREEEIQIRELIDMLSKRDKAIILLSLSLGLRESDICKLKFSEIDWNNDSIHLVQKKTGNPLTLPLVKDVGNALMDYILNERPAKATCKEVFVRKQAPYKAIKSIYTIVSRALSKITYSQDRPRGSHVLRKTLVYRLLNNDISHQVITDILGHTSKDCDKFYYSVETEKLRECSLRFSEDIGFPSFIKRDGGRV